MALAVVYFVRSGYVGPGNALYGAGSYGDDWSGLVWSGLVWSGLAGSSNFAYELYFNSSYVPPSSTNSRYVGASVRCVAGWE